MSIKCPQNETRILNLSLSYSHKCMQISRYLTSSYPIWIFKHIISEKVLYKIELYRCVWSTREVSSFYLLWQLITHVTCSVSHYKSNHVSVLLQRTDQRKENWARYRSGQAVREITNPQPTESWSSYRAGHTLPAPEEPCLQAGRATQWHQHNLLTGAVRSFIQEIHVHRAGLKEM